MTNTTENDANTSVTLEVVRNSADSPPNPAAPKPKQALVHGIYASDNVLPWESEEDFERLYNDLRTEWDPTGRTEEETVLALARLHWLKHRLMRSTHLAFHRDPFVAELEKSGAKSWTDVANSLKKEGLIEDDLMDEVRETLEALRAATKLASSQMTASDQASQDTFTKVETVEHLFQKMMPVYGKLYDRCYGRKTRTERGDDLYLDVKTTVEKAYHPDYLEKIIRLDASIDTRIDKTLSRLVSIKEYKRLIKPAANKHIANQTAEAA
ncbi:MAG: hypothetical protein WAM62_13900 [Pseudolabrys sp.]